MKARGMKDKRQLISLISSVNECFIEAATCVKITGHYLPIFGCVFSKEPEDRTEGRDKTHGAQINIVIQCFRYLTSVTN
jgi:hypothetical protein